MKSREVQWNLGAQVFCNPKGHIFDFRHGVVLPRDQQVGQFEPDIGFFFQVDQCFEDGIKVCAAEFPVKTFCECLQVNVGGIQMTY